MLKFALEDRVKVKEKPCNSFSGMEGTVKDYRYLVQLDEFHKPIWFFVYELQEL